jgi:glycosyltransferase involved in cell wall biosynthesis
MSAADVLALASEAEGWPNVVHEAMACGTPVVATDVGAIPEMIPSPELGFRVPFGDTGALRDALRMALARDWDRGAIARYAQGRAWDKVAAEVVEVLEEVVAEHAGGEARCYPEIRR